MDSSYSASATASSASARNDTNNVSNSLCNTETDSMNTFPDSSRFIQRLREQETARRVQNEEKLRKTEDERRSQHDQLVRTQTNAVTTALNDALNTPNATYAEVSFSESVCQEVLNSITNNGYEYSLYYTNNNGRRSSVLKVYPRGTMPISEYASNNTLSSLNDYIDRYLYNSPLSFNRLTSFRPWNINTYRLL